MATPLSSGVWGVLATPFQGSALDLCEASLERETAYYSKVGVTGLTVLGVFGEAHGLTAVEQREVLDTVVAVKGDLPIVVGVPGRATHTVIEQADNATSVTEEIAGLMVQVNSADAHALLRHLNAVHDATGLPLRRAGLPAVSGVRIDRRRPRACGQRPRARVRRGGQGRGAADAARDRHADGRRRRPGLRWPRRGRPAGRARLRRGGSDDRLQPPRGTGASARRVRRGGFEAARGLLGAVAAAGQLRGPAAGSALPSARRSCAVAGVLDHPRVRAPAATVPDGAPRRCSSQHLADAIAAWHSTGAPWTSDLPARSPSFSASTAGLGRAVGARPSPPRAPTSSSSDAAPSWSTSSPPTLPAATGRRRATSPTPTRSATSSPRPRAVIGAVDILVLNGAGRRPGTADALHRRGRPGRRRPAAARPRRARLRAAARDARARLGPDHRDRVERRAAAACPTLTASNVGRAALAAYLKTLAGDVAGDGVTVNMVLPGRIDTDRVAQLDRRRRGAHRAHPRRDPRLVRGRHPGRPLRPPEEFGAVVAFLAPTPPATSPASRSASTAASPAATDPYRLSFQETS